MKYSPAHEDGTDSEFRNVGNYNSDAGDEWSIHLPMKMEPTMSSETSAIRTQTPGMKYSPAYEDGTDSEFRNVGNQNSDAGELPKKEQITFRTRRKLKNRTCNYITASFHSN